MHPLRFLLVGTASLPILVLTCSDLGAQSLLSAQGQVIAANDDVVPGLTGGETFTGTSLFDSAVMEDGAKVFFRGRFSGASTSGTTDRAYFYGTSKDDLVLVVRSGFPEPSGTIPGATLQSGTSSGISSSPRISANGIMMFGSSLYDGGLTVNSSNDTAIYVGQPGTFAILVREGDPAVGTVGATYSSSFSSPSQQLTCINASGRVMFQSSLTGGDVNGSVNNAAWYTGDAASQILEMVIRKGDIAPGGEQIAAISPGYVAQMNSMGQIIHDVSFVVGTGTTPVTAADDRALWIWTPGVGNQSLVREGDVAPIPGATFSNPATNSWTINMGPTAFNASGQALIRADLGGAVSAGIDDNGLFLLSLAGHALAVRRGDVAPGIPGAVFDVFNNTSLQLNDAGMIAFEGALSGGSVTTADDTGIWAGLPGSLVLVAREGDVAPGTGGSTFGSTNGQQMTMNGAGQILFNNTLAGGTVTGSSLWSWDPVLGLQSVVLPGDVIETQPGTFRAVSGQGSVQFSNGDARALSFGHDGTAVLRLTTAGSTGAIATVRIGSLSGYPRAISLAAGGQQKLHLQAGQANAGSTYFLVGSLSGTTPGFDLGPVHVPLNPDFLLSHTIVNPNAPPLGNTLGMLDSEGHGLATFTVPAGTRSVPFHIEWAFVVLDPAFHFVFASEVAGVDILP